MCSCTELICNSIKFCVIFRTECLSISRYVYTHDGNPVFGKSHHGNRSVQTALDVHLWNENCKKKSGKKETPLDIFQTEERRKKRTNNNTEPILYGDAFFHKSNQQQWTENPTALISSTQIAWWRKKSERISIFIIRIPSYIFNGCFFFSLGNLTTSTGFTVTPFFMYSSHSK